MSNVNDHQKDYKPDAWMQYTNEELSQWVVLLTKRSQHRLFKKSMSKTLRKKALKDLDDAKNYLWMLTEKTKLENSSMRNDRNL